MSNVESIYNLSRQTAQELTNGRWQEFLRSAAWSFKYSFPNQILIFAQRPDAKACADPDTWSKRLHRVVKPDAAAIALLDDGGDNMRLRHVFDVSDTYSPDNTPVPLWSLTQQKMPAVRAALANAYLSGADDLWLQSLDDETFLRVVVNTVVLEQSDEAAEELLSSRMDSPAFANLTDREVEYQFKELLIESVFAVMAYRCGLEPEFIPSKFSPVSMFSDPEHLAILGQATQTTARQVIDIVARAVKVWDRTHKEEKQHESELSESRGVQSPRPDNTRTTEAEPLREDAQELPAEQQTEPLRSPSDDGRAERASELSRDPDHPSGGADDGIPAGSEPEQDAGAAAPSGGGTGLPADNLRLSGEDSDPLPAASESGLDVHFPTSAEQEAAVKASNQHNRLTQDEIDSILTNPNESAVPREMLADIFRENPGIEALAGALDAVYCYLVFDHTFPDGTTADVTGLSYGLQINREGEEYLLGWHALAERLNYLVESGRYLPQEEEHQPTSSAELEMGQIFLLNGMKYQVIELSDASVLLQDTEHPIFTQEMPRAILDILLAQAAAHSAPAPEHGEDFTEHTAEEQPAAEQPASPDEFQWDHPELRRQDLSRLAREDKVVLADLMTHFIDYRVSFSNAMPSLPANDALAYLSEREELEAMTVSDDVDQNLAMIEAHNAFLNRWFVPFAPELAEHIQQDLELVLDAAERFLADPSVARKEAEQEHTKMPAEEPFAPAEENITFAVGDTYRDANGGGVVSHVLAPDESGRVAGAFGYKDPETGKSLVMDMPTAIGRIRNGEATLEKGNGILPDWMITPDVKPEGTEQVDTEPSLFDFRFDEPAEHSPIPQPVQVTAEPRIDAQGRTNFRITEMDPNYGGPKARFRNNIDAITLLKELERDERLATPEEQIVLSRYVGWGGLPQAFDPRAEQWRNEYNELKDLLTEEEYASARASTNTAFYTPPVVTEAIWDGLRRLGFTRGNILDPCCGTGNFFGSLPEDMKDSKLYGVELDSISGRISRQLYQQANIVIDGYEKTSLPDSIYDVAVGNVPFDNYQLPDRRYDKHHFLIHDYFFAKTLDKVRPGGVVAFITSKGTLDKKNDSVRKYLAQRADLLGAIRLPDNTFRANAGTDAVSDIIFLRKRERPSIDEPSWVGLDRAWLPEKLNWGPAINSYFVENPDMVLGDMVEVSGPHGPVWTCRAREGEDLRAALQRAISNIEGQIGDLSETLDEPERQENRHSIPADPDVRNFSYTLVDGDVYFREDSRMFRADLNKTAEQRVKGLIELRDITRELIDAQVNNASDSEITALQQNLNAAYDKYTAKYGIISSRANELAFSEDSSYYLLCSLERLDDEGNFKGKADMFTKRTIGQHREITHVDTAEEALGASMGELARIDLEYMSSVSGLSKEELIRNLDGIIFPLPGNPDRYELSSTYLSGNVREKFAEAKEAAKKDPRFRNNAVHLAQAMPEPLGPDAIAVRLGSTWVPPEDYKDFMFELLDMPEYLRHSMNVVYSEYTDHWSITNKTWPMRSVKSDTEYGTKQIDAYHIIEQTLNLKDVQVYDTVEMPDGSTRRVINVNETLAAQEKQQKIKDAFKDWVWQDPDRRDRLCAIYNERFNSIVPPTYNGEMVRFHGLNPAIQLEPHQKESVARILYGGNTLLAHTVGAGKTWTMTAAAMEGKHLGLCNKSLVVVPNHLVGQWAAAIYEAYPQANVLASTKKDFEPANRKKFCSRIATGDYDMVVIGHTQFERIPLSAERQIANLEEQREDILSSLNDLKAAKAESFSIKELERARKNLDNKLEKLNNAKKRDNVITFEELGVDRLFVDESHEYKNLFLYSKMHNVAGVSQTDSQKASDLFMKCRYMDEVTGNMGNIHATGTPVSNTMAETYTIQRYLQYDALKKMGLTSFDAWASTFGETVVALELAPEGNGYRPRTRFAKFFNLPELMNMFKQVADIRTKDMLNLPVPNVQFETVVLKPSEHQIQMVKGLGERADKIRTGGVNNKEDNMLCITNDGRKLALDQRLLDPTLPDNPDSKANACADRVFRVWQQTADTKATQLIFCDLSTPSSKKPIEMQQGEDGAFEAIPSQFTNVYEDLKEKLIQRGIPADEIRFVHEAKNEAQKEALFAKVRSGTVRVLMGSTAKLGTGTNVQDRLIGGHDLDCPWRPSDLEQRLGRVERRGNTNESVFMTRYVTEGTFDAYMYQLQEAKQRFISQIFTSKNPAREANDIDDATLRFSEIKALTSGDARIKDKVTLEIEISKLEVLKGRHQAEQHRLDQDIRHRLPGQIQSLTTMLPELERDDARAKAHPHHDAAGNFVPINIKGTDYETATDAGTALLAALDKISAACEWRTLGSFRGFELRGEVADPAARNVVFKAPQLALVGDRTYNLRNFGDSPVGVIQRLNNILDKYIPQHIVETRENLANAGKQLESCKAEYGKPFAKEAELEEKKARLAVLDRELDLSLKQNEDKTPDHENEDFPPQDVSREGERSSLDSMIASAAKRAESQQVLSGQYRPESEQFIRH